jgi:pimeloyl-ACP methyl ester carboxylesterase
MMPQLNHRMIQVNGIRMHVAEQGEGPLVLLCHGFPETWYSWRHQLPALANAGFRAVALDMRGYGETTAPGAIDQYTLFHLVGDLVNLVQALGARQAFVVGNDWGATVAWHAALLRPDLFNGVAAFGVPMMEQPPVPPTTVFPQTDHDIFYGLYFQEAGSAERELAKDVRTTLSKLLYSASGNAGERSLPDTPNPFGMVSKRTGLLAALPDKFDTLDWLSPNDLIVYANAFEASGFSGGLNYYRNLDRNRELLEAYRGAKITVPALYIVGERDTGFCIPGMSQIIDDMPKLVPHLKQSIVLPGAGHWLQQEAPDTVNAALIAFLQSL